MNESYQEKVSKKFKKTDPKRFGDASMTVAEFGALRELHKKTMSKISEKSECLFLLRNNGVNEEKYINIVSLILNNC